MRYRSIADLSAAIRKGLHILPRDIDLVVGIPRSGVLAGSILALQSNLKFTSLDAFIANTPVLTGATRSSRHPELTEPQRANHVLLVDDSAASGNSLAAAVQAIRNSGYFGKMTSCVIYLAPGCDGVDIYFELLPHIRIFEWNVMHRSYLQQCCVDLDGVLVRDPTDEENDDGSKYLEFLRDTKPLLVPTCKIGRIVTSRLEKYRTQTELWLKQQGIEYGNLDMLDLPDASTRRRLRVHASFKASVYKKHSDMGLFIESDRMQSIEITRLSGKPTLSISTQELFQPGYTLAYAHQASRRWLAKAKRLLNRLGRRG